MSIQNVTLTLGAYPQVTVQTDQPGDMEAVLAAYHNMLAELLAGAHRISRKAVSQPNHGTPVADKPADTGLKIIKVSDVEPSRIGTAPEPEPEPEVSRLGLSCRHGQRTHRDGVSKTGKPWAGWFCPTEKGAPDQCEPVWDR